MIEMTGAVEGSELASTSGAERSRNGMSTLRLIKERSYEQSMNDTPILVTAGILVDNDHILVCQRHHSDRYGLQWEFPGGKVNDGEDLKSALRRELIEELAIEAEVGEEVFRLRHRYPDRYVEVVFLAVTSFRGTVENRIFEAVEWVSRRALPSYDFLEADRELVNRLARGEIV